MTLRRGFKKDADEYAREMRHELQLRSSDPLCPWTLANHLEIDVFPLSALKSSAPAAIKYLMAQGRSFFFAVTVFTGRHGRKRSICVNDGNPKTRQAADVAHELSHALLGHPPTEAFKPDSVAEEEARWMGPALLVSSEAALTIARQRLPLADASAHYGVSEQLMRMRLNVTGALKRAG